LLSLPLFRKSGGETIDKISIKKVLAKSLTIFQPKKVWIVSSVRAGMTHQSILPPQSENLDGCKGAKTIFHPSLLPDFTPVDFFPLPDHEDRAS
jgi:hypothetical protein